MLLAKAQMVSTCLSVQSDQGIRFLCTELSDTVGNADEEDALIRLRKMHRLFWVSFQVFDIRTHFFFLRLPLYIEIQKGPATCSKKGE